jgi:hypothetical protein
MFTMEGMVSPWELIECVSKKRLRLKNPMREVKKRDTNINFIV